MSDPETLLAGDEVAEHLILRVLEREESGWVYLAEDPDGARVRLRVLASRALEDERVRGRILQDLATLQALEHPNLSRFLAYGEEGPVFYSLEHNGSATLFDLVYHRRPLDAEELLWVARGLVSALAVLHEAGIPHGQLGATSIVLREDGPVLVDLGLDARLDPGYSVEHTKRADLLALQQVMGFAASGPNSDSGDETQALNPGAARLINALSQADTLAEAREAVERLVEDSAKTGVDSQPVLADFMNLLEASDYSSGVYRRLDVPKTEISEVLSASSVEGDPLADTDPGFTSGTTLLVPPPEPGPDLLTSRDVSVGESEERTPLVQSPEVSQEGLFESEERTPLVEAPPPYPRRLGDYVLLEEIGRGKGGTVHLARAKEAQNLVALRTLDRKAFARPEDLERVWRKADALASLDDPVFARVLDRGEAGGEPYVVSELVAGRTLDEVAKQGVDVERGLLPLLLPVLEAVGEANEAGIVDGRLRTDHVVIDAERRPRLIDFGLAASYRDPLAKEPSDDVAAASRLVYRVASGGRSPAQEGWRVTLLGDPVPPSAFVPSLRTEVDAVVLKALAPEKRKRYPSVTALHEDLGRALAGGQPVAPPVPAGRRAALWAVARPLVTAGFAFWAICTLVFFVLALTAPSAAPPPPPPAQDAAAIAAQVDAARTQAQADALCQVAERLFDQGRVREARGFFGEALLLDPDSQAAREGADRAQSAEASLDQRRADAERDAALAIQDGLGALDEGDAAQAREHLETAQAMQRLLLDEVGATEGDVELTAQLLRLQQGLDRLQGGGGGSAEDPDALERQVRARVQEAEAAARADREQRAGQLVTQGDEALAKSDKGTATQRYLDALALYPEHPDALRGLRAALTPEVEPGTQADSVASWAMDQKEALRADAERARARGEHKRAEERLLQALAFAPRDPQLLAALEAVREQLRREQSGPVGERVASAVSRGEEALERARTATNRGDAALHYLTAQGEFSAALTLDPNRSDLAGELSKIKEEAVELFTPQATVEEAAPTRPDDPHLEFEEGDQVAITRALGHKVRFASPGNTFAALREEVEKAGGGRFRVFLRLRTRAERVPSGGLQSVQVMARGFEVQLEDKQQRLRWPWRFLPFEDGPYPRATRLERDGTVVVSSFFSAQPAAMKNELARLEALVRGLIEDALRADTR